MAGAGRAWIFSADRGFCARNIPDVALAAGCAVGLSIAAMHQWKCIHPPGGATALTAVIGGVGVHELGYSFVWLPVLLNAAVLVAMAVLFNYFYPWRRYPAFLNRSRQSEYGDEEVTHEEVVSALESFDSFVDITEDDLIRLHHLLSKRVSQRGTLNPFPHEVGETVVEETEGEQDHSEHEEAENAVKGIELPDVHGEDASDRDDQQGQAQQTIGAFPQQETGGEHDESEERPRDGDEETTVYLRDQSVHQQPYTEDAGDDHDGLDRGGDRHQFRQAFAAELLSEQDERQSGKIGCEGRITAEIRQGKGNILPQRWPEPHRRATRDCG